LSSLFENMLETELEFRPTFRVHAVLSNIAIIDLK
jgi:hypothetical protein